MSVTLDVLGLRLPQPAWVVLDALRREGFTGEARLVGSPVTRVFTDRGRIYLAENDGVAPLGARLVAAGVLTADELARGVVRVGADEHLGHLFERAPSVDPAAVQVALEGITEATLQFVAGQVLAAVTLRPYAFHPSGVHLWADTPGRAVRAPAAPVRPLDAPPHDTPVGAAPVAPAWPPATAPAAPVAPAWPPATAPAAPEAAGVAVPADSPATHTPPSAPSAADVSDVDRGDIAASPEAPVLPAEPHAAAPVLPAPVLPGSAGPDTEAAPDQPAPGHDPVEWDDADLALEQWAVSAPGVPGLPDDTFSVIWPDGDAESPPPFDASPAEPEPLLARLEPAEVPDDIGSLVLHLGDSVGAGNGHTNGHGTEANVRPDPTDTARGGSGPTLSALRRRVRPGTA